MIQISHMKQLLTLIICAVMLAATSVVAQPVKIGYLDAQRLERDSKRIQRVAETLKKEFAAREQELRETQKKVGAAQVELDKLSPNTPAPEMQRKQREFTSLAQRFEQLGRTFNEDLERRKNEERAKFFRDVTQIVTKIAETQKFDIVLQEAVYASKGVDITDQVVKTLDAGS
jgi:outer membrane protein